VTLRSLFSKPAVWWTIAVVLGALLLFAAVDNRVYEVTSPASFDYHVILRKIYSIIAFAAVGYPIARARMAAGRPATPIVIAGLIAGYSAVIEVLQFALDPPWEGIVSNLLDVGYGLAGGAFAAWVASKTTRRS